jgi:hypothetical protein
MFQCEIFGLLFGGGRLFDAGGGVLLLPADTEG